MADSKCLPRIPYEKWAVDAGLEGGEKDWANWKYMRIWAQKLLDGCMSGGDCCCFTLPFSIGADVIQGLYSAPGPVEASALFDRATIYLTAQSGVSASDITLDVIRANDTGSDTSVQSFTLPQFTRRKFFTSDDFDAIEVYETEALYVQVSASDGDTAGLSLVLYGACADVEPHFGGGG